MALKTYKLGEFLLPYDCRNKDLSVTLFQGITTNKVFSSPKQVAEDIGATKIVRKGQFAYNRATTRNGEKISIAYRDEEDCAVSAAYQVFYIKENAPLLPKYLYIFFNRNEFDRYARCNSWGSAHEFFTFNDMCNVEISLPDLPTQQKYVDIYESMVANQKSYEKGLDDLKLTCDAYIEELRRKTKCEKIGPYINRYDLRNGKNGTTNVMGVSVLKEFREPSSKVNKSELSNYKVCHPGDIAFVQTTNNEKCFAYALNKTEKDIVVSSVDEVFSTQKNTLLAEFLSIFLSRKEFDRYARFHSWGSARETFTWKDLQEVQIPIPDISVQRSIADIYKVYTERKRINEQLKQQIKDICPILIKGSLEE